MKKPLSESAEGAVRCCQDFPGTFHSPRGGAIPAVDPWGFIPLTAVKHIYLTHSWQWVGDT